MARILAISPHPDDVELGCGGAMKRFSLAGGSIVLAVATGEGDLLMAHSGQNVPFSTRREEQEAAARLLGISRVEWLNWGPAAGLADMKRAVSSLDALIAQGFDALYIPAPSYNQDHRFVWEACRAAIRPGRCDRASVYAYEQPMRFAWPDGLVYSRYVALSEDCVRAKMGALAAHRSQVGGRAGSLVGPAGVEQLARLRGLEIGEEYAEAFCVVRELV